MPCLMFLKSTTRDNSYENTEILQDQIQIHKLMENTINWIFLEN